jgi:hypothetical protein
VTLDSGKSQRAAILNTKVLLIYWKFSGRRSSRGASAKNSQTEGNDLSGEILDASDLEGLSTVTISRPSSSAWWRVSLTGVAFTSCSMIYAVPEPDMPVVGYQHQHSLPDRGCDFEQTSVNIVERMFSEMRAEHRKYPIKSSVS